MLTLWNIGGQLKGMCGGFDEDEVGDRQNDGVVPSESNDNSVEVSMEVQSAIDINDVDATNHNVKSASSLKDATSEMPELNESTSMGALSTSGLASTMPRASVTSVLKKELSSIEYGRLIFIHKIDLKNRHFQFQTETLNHLVYLEIRIPEAYPNESPEFELLHRTTLSQKRGFAIIKRLNNVALGYTNRAMPCLEPCLKIFQQEMEAITNEEKNEQMIKKPRFYRDSNIPFPRISGARFSGRGQLVCFGWTTQASEHLPKGARKTPRALSALSGNAAAAGASRPSSSSNSTSLSSLLENNAINESQSSWSSPGTMRKSSSKSSPGVAVAGKKFSSSSRHRMVRLSSVPAGQLLTNSSIRYVMFRCD